MPVGDRPIAVNRQAHWDCIYTTKASQEMSWFQAEPITSVELIERSGLTPDTCVIDVGGGDSRLVDWLLLRGLRCISVLDVSPAALDRARARLREKAGRVTWIEADVTTRFDAAPVDVWHDRATFHFLTEAHDRARYVARLCELVKPRGAVIIGTFAPDGPERCSGLPVCRYDSAALGAELGTAFSLVETVRQAHRTPAGIVQSFNYARFVRDA